MNKSILLTFLCGFALQCNVSNSIDNASIRIADVLEGAIVQLGASSANIQQIMDETLKNLPSDIQSTIRTEISSTFQRAIGTAGTEIRCNLDFLRNRLRQDLQKLKSKILGGSVPELNPEICTVDPAAIEMELAPNRRNALQFFGYDLDAADIQVKVLNGNAETDVTRFLSKTTHYHMVLNLSANGVVLTPQSTKIVLKHKNAELSTIQVLGKTLDVCETVSRELAPLQQKITIIPDLIKGDREFDGNGPRMDAAVLLRIVDKNKVKAFFSIFAKEIGGDTEAHGQKEEIMYVAPTGYDIVRIISPTVGTAKHEDRKTDVDEEMGGSGPVQGFTFTGDTKGDDVGETKIHFGMNKIVCELKESRDCVSGSAIRTLVQQNAFSTQRLSKIRAVSPKVLEIPKSQ